MALCLVMISVPSAQAGSWTGLQKVMPVVCIPAYLMVLQNAVLC